jgi:peptidoglycan/xylan/chitin deacetylase (PgdA/CDA1 family)
LRAALKHFFEHLLVRGTPTRLARWLARRPLVLAYHNIVPHGEPRCGDVSLHLSQREFARQLDLLGRQFRVVPLAEALEPAARGSRPRIAITFDDAYCGAVTAGVDELARRGMPATVFVAPGLLERQEFWWDRYAAPGSAGLDAAFRRHALTELRGSLEPIDAWASERGRAGRTLPAHARSATEGELRGAVARPGVVLGSHTWSHPNLAALGGHELGEELTRPLEWLRSRFSAVIPWLSYPYGLASPEVEEAANGAGYQGAVRIDGGRLGARAGRFAVPRLDVPAGISLEGFALRTTGILSR